MKRTNDFFMFVLIGLTSVITLAVLVQGSADRVLILGAGGFAFFTFAWVGMYFRLKRELPEHPLVGATYLNNPFGVGGGRRAGLRNMLRLIQLHFERHSMDRWLTLLIGGVAMLAASLIDSAF